MHRSVIATTACAIFALAAMTFCAGGLIFADLTLKSSVLLVSGIIGAGVLLLGCLWLLTYQWHQPMYKVD